MRLKADLKERSVKSAVEPFVGNKVFA